MSFLRSICGNTYIYCPFCGREIPEVENRVNAEQENEVRQVLENQSEEELITYYFRQGFVYQNGSLTSNKLETGSGNVPQFV